MRGQWFATYGRDLVACFAGGDAEGDLGGWGGWARELGASGDAARRFGFEPCCLSAISPQQRNWLPRWRIPPIRGPSGSTTSSARGAALPSSPGRSARPSRSASASRAEVTPQNQPRTPHHDLRSPRTMFSAQSIAAAGESTPHLSPPAAMPSSDSRLCNERSCASGVALPLDSASVSALTRPCPSILLAFSTVMLRPGQANVI